MRPGAVVAYRGRIGVVWRVMHSGLAIVPVVPGQPRTRGDLAVDGLADRIAVVAMGASCVRAGYVLSVPAEGQECVGYISPALMAADSCSFREGRRYPTFPKIVRASDGSLAGVAGSWGNTQEFKAWFLYGEDSPIPKMDGGNDADFSAMIVRPDGALWVTFGDGRLVRSAVTQDAVGESVAAGFCEAVMTAGLDAEAAVRLTIEHCVYAGGNVQVERL